MQVRLPAPLVVATAKEVVELATDVLTGRPPLEGTDQFSQAASALIAGKSPRSEAELSVEAEDAAVFLSVLADSIKALDKTGSLSRTLARRLVLSTKTVVSPTHLRLEPFAAQLQMLLR
jgi:hypothetical protein